MSEYLTQEIFYKKAKDYIITHDINSEWFVFFHSGFLMLVDTVN